MIEPRFDVVKFYETLAKIMSDRYEDIEVTVEVTRKSDILNKNIVISN